MDTSRLPQTPIDAAQCLDDVIRAVRPCERDGGFARTLVLRVRFDAAPAELWDALTDPSRLAQWFLPVSGDLRVGGRYALEANASGRITTCEPRRSLDLTWEWDGHLSWVSVSLSPGSQGTWFQLEHTEPLPDDAPDEYGPGAGGVGWDQAVLALRAYLTDRIVSRPDFDAWLASPEGHRFTGASSDAWCAAWIAAGAPPEVARKAASRTVAAYTGIEPPAML